MTEESGRPGTSRSKVGWLAIDEPCTNRMMPLAWAGSASHLFNRKSFTLPSLVVQCSVPARRCGEGDLAVSFMAVILGLYCWSMIFSENRYPLFGIMLYCGLMLFALMSFAHLAISDSMWAPNCAGVIGSGLASCFSHDSLMSGRVMTLLISRLSRSTIGCGVPLGAIMPIQIVAS